MEMDAHVVANDGFQPLDFIIAKRQNPGPAGQSFGALLVMSPKVILACFIHFFRLRFGNIMVQRRQEKQAAPRTVGNQWRHQGCANLLAVAPDPQDQQSMQQV